MHYCPNIIGIISVYSHASDLLQERLHLDISSIHLNRAVWVASTWIL